MPGFHVFTSNRTETLAARLAEALREPLAHPLAPEVIVVQSRGMERWVAMELARLNGICANTRFPFPNAFLDEIFGKILTKDGRDDAFSADVLLFRIMDLLPDALAHPDFRALRDYLADDPGELKRYQICRRLAGLFDQYAVFRPEMLLEWDRGRVERDPDHRWEARLWRMLADGRGPHRARLWRECLERLERVERRPDGFPERVALFGVSYLPPAYLQAFTRLSRLIRVSVFLLNPCREYWGAILPERSIGRIVERHRDVERSLLHLERGHPLLSSWGGMGREFMNLLDEAPANERSETFVEAGDGCLLACVQEDILRLRDPDIEEKSGPSAAADGSIAVHSCHGPMREIEVLHDQLLSMFEELPGLRPADIVVMAPDIARYAPYIAAVFGSPDDGDRRIPYGVADHAAGGQSVLEAVWSAVLALKGGRLGAMQVLRLLEFEPVRRRFGIAEADLPLIGSWVRDSGIRWGADERARRSLGLPAERQNTWAHGLDRLLLGYAMPCAEDGPFHGILPLDAVEGAAAQALSAFLAFTEAVVRAARELEGARSLSDWGRVFQGLADGLWQTDEALEAERQRFVEAIGRLAGMQISSGFERPVPLEVAREFVAEHLDAAHAGRGFLSGGVTFCALVPMRTIPFDVVCLIGMDYDAFPRDTPPLSFDLIARAPRPGDRSRRDDDRYLFLEALLAARRRFYVSYVGQDIQDNSPRPPSVLVSELLDALDKGYGVNAEHLVCRHPLQAFAPEYFKGDVLFSFNRENLEACRAAAGDRNERWFHGEPLPERAQDVDPEVPVSIDRLVEFLSNPARFLSIHRLGIRLAADDALLEETEPFTLDSLDAYHIEQQVLEACLSGNDPMNLFPAYRASGELPHGRVGEILFRRCCAEAGRLAETARALLPPGGLSGAMDVACEVDGRRLAGRLPRVTRSGCVQLRCAGLKAKDYLRAWVGHLVLHLARPDIREPQSLLIGSDRQLMLTPVTDAAAALAGLLALFRRGMRQPVHLFAECALAYAQKLRASSNPDAALAAAFSRWDGYEDRGESRDIYNRLWHGGRRPLDGEFRAIAAEVFGTLLAHCDSA
ncbi:MAG: exodeoxyribonuclease V subunit gamma [Desulfobacterales bacterium]|nr:exodeoxyribonuclease V subunit gamma [Desulfobacterales bacterium]